MPVGIARPVLGHLIMTTPIFSLPCFLRFFLPIGWIVPTLAEGGHSNDPDRLSCTFDSYRHHSLVFFVSSKTIINSNSNWVPESSEATLRRKRRSRTIPQLPPWSGAAVDIPLDNAVCGSRPARARRRLTSVHGPMRRFTATERDACNGAQTRQSADEARTAALDPRPTSILACPGCRRRRWRHHHLLATWNAARAYPHDLASEVA